MSVLFGKWNQDGEVPEAAYLEQVRKLLAPYGPDAQGTYTQNGITILQHFLYTTAESKCSARPLVTPSGAVVAWDGRLDNRDELRVASGIAVDGADVQLVAAAWERWGEHCFAHLLGDWALSIWEPRTRRVVLAKDFLGCRPLYYSVTERAITWSTLLEPLICLAGRSFALEEEYLAGWLLHFPAAHLTPYAGIRAVPPASYVVFRDSQITIHKYWDFAPGHKTYCRTDAEYEEQFRTKLEGAVRRRLRSDRPVLAELSGGMDSSTIVCMADRIMRRESAVTPRLDTLSYFDDAEPNWNERPYVQQVELQRGRQGCHIDVSGSNGLGLADCTASFSATPGANLHDSQARGQFVAYVVANGIRVVLSGTGGDEVLGGVPDPTPELANLLRGGHLWRWWSQMTAWALALRKPLFGILAETVRSFLPTRKTRVPTRGALPAWIHTDYLPTASVRSQRFTVRGPSPGFQDSLHTLDTLRRQFAAAPITCCPLYEKRFPYLDRDLLEFLFAVPPEQLLQPHRRRFLMRRSMVGIVPEGVLNRRRKAYVERSPIVDLLREAPTLISRLKEMPPALLRIVDPSALSTALRELPQKPAIPLIPLLRVVGLDAWLQGLTRSGLWNGQVLSSLPGDAPN